MAACLRKIWSYRPSASVVVSLGLCQGISVLIAGTGITSSLLASLNVTLSSTQSFFNYFLLLIYLVIFAVRRRWQGLRDTVRGRWWMYVCLAVCDVEANFLVVLAYQYTSLSSVMLLDCFSIPCVMLLGRLLLNRRFGWPQFVGVLLCLAGVVALLVSDWTEGAFGSAPASHPVLGDMLCLAAAVLYAVSNTGQELVVVEGSKVEYLAMLALFATPLSAAQSAGVDYASYARTPWSAEVVGLMAAFALCMFCVYSLVPLALEREGATFLNLSLLTSDVFAIVAGIYLFDYVPTVLYIVSAVLIVLGLIMYNINVTPQPPPPDSVAPDEENASAPLVN